MTAASGIQPGANGGGSPAGVPEVSVVIVSWNTRDVLRDCLRSVFEQAGDVSLEVIVSDNDSKDGSQGMVRSEFPRVMLVENGRNLGFAAANNAGIRKSHGHWALLLNPDTIVLEGAIAKAVAYSRGHPKAGIVGCLVLENMETVQRTCFAFPRPWNSFMTEFGLARLFPKSGFFNHADMGSWNRDTEREVEVISGMFMLVRREVLEQVGLLDEAYFVYAEEADLCFRARRAGWTCVFTPTARIIHCDGGGKSTGQVSVRMFVQLQKSLSIFHRKNWGYGAYLRLKWIYITSLVARLSAYGTLGLIRPTESRRNGARASWAALKYHLAGVEPAAAQAGGARAEATPKIANE